MYSLLGCNIGLGICEVLVSRCGSVGRVVASDARDLRFVSSHWQIYLLKGQTSRNRGREWPIQKVFGKHISKLIFIQAILGLNPLPRTDGSRKVCIINVWHMFIIFSVKFDNVLIRTEDLWCQKRPLCQLIHNDCPNCHSLLLLLKA